ncbi:hypothetical protein ACTVNX_14490 [Serratia nevei]|uniref:hypothetical protein n=1 Tax=Serratia TaxID=613 RepID=UPI0018D87510|nr:hypothetical protein [Serratia marcescens]MBI6128611.1 hypothetical protein [Serratia marcescens]MBN5302746.1 hypothetical protein [Serratia marcescens]BEM42750.1 hypothetical protein SME13J_13690 [Serratia marcescens]
MDWQGIPFKFFGEDPLQQAFLSVSHLPNIIVKTDFALDTFLSGLVAGFIPAAVAIWAMVTNAKNIRDERLHQEKLSSTTITKQIVSASRQVWINDLRESTAKFIGMATGLINCLNSMVDEYNPNDNASSLYMKLYEEHRIAMSELGLLKSKIELLLNPEEERSQRVSDALDKLREFLLKDREPDEDIDFDELTPHMEKLKECIYAVIKHEWKKISVVESETVGS